MNLFTNRRTEFQTKIDRLRKRMQEKNVENLLITQAHNFSWLTCGAENFVFFAMSAGAAPLLVTPDTVYLVSNNIESVRQVAEELHDLRIEDCRHQWHLSNDEITAHYQSMAKGNCIKDTDFEEDIQQLRDPLCEDEMTRYRWLGERAEEAMRVTCQSVQPGMTEYEVVGHLAQECLSRTIWPALLLIASDDRAYNFRHPLPTDKPIEDHFMLVLGARRYGLVTSLTRMVSFKLVPGELYHKHEAVCHIDSVLIHASRPGAQLGDVLRKGVDAYREYGYPGEWKHHHQGGITGYLGRTYKATPDIRVQIQTNQALAWNPTIAGTKSEDTIITHDDGVEIITQAKDWPMIETNIDGRTLERCAFLIP